MLNSKVYINKRLVVDFDKFTASFADGGTYIFSSGEYKNFYDAFSHFCSLPLDSSNMFTTYIKDKFIFIDCRRNLKDINE